MISSPKGPASSRLHCTAPSYLCDCLQFNTPSHILHSLSLQIPHTDFPRSVPTPFLSIKWPSPLSVEKILSGLLRICPQGICFAQTRLTSFLPLMLLPSSALCPDSLSNIFVNCLLCIPPSRCPCGWVSLEWPLWTRFCTFEILSLSNYYDYYHFSLKLLGSSYWAIQAGLLTPLTFAWHSLSPWAAFTSGAYFLHNGRRWQWICKFYTANFKGIFGGP